MFNNLSKGNALCVSKIFALLRCRVKAQ
jgi:hypothetical protein